jgi:hypothetical protein
MDDVEIQAACAALGYLDGDKYQKEPDCLGRESEFAFVLQ